MLMRNKVKIRRRGKRRYFAVEIPKELRRFDEGRTEVMASSREELREKFEAETTKRKQGLDREAGRMTLADFLEKKFLPFYRGEGGVEIQTWADYRFHTQANIVPLLGGIPLEKLTTRDLDQWSGALRGRISERTKKPLSDRSIEYAFAVLRRALQYAVDWRYIAMNPASARMRVAKRRRKAKPSVLRFFTPEQAKKFLEVIHGDRYEALYLLAITTGMREGELFGLKWSDVNLDAASITVNHAIAQTKRKKGEAGDRFVLKGPKTEGSRRTIEIPAVAVTALREQERRQQELRELAGEQWQEQGYVFASRLGGPLDHSNTLHRFQQLCEKHGLPKLRFYDLRHTHASLLIAEGVHAKKIAERLGHSSIKLTMDTYGHLFEGSDRESAASMDRLFGAPEAGSGVPPKLILIRGGQGHADKNADKTWKPASRRSATD
jgi:integrase